MNSTFQNSGRRCFSIGIFFTLIIIGLFLDRCRLPSSTVSRPTCAARRRAARPRTCRGLPPCSPRFLGYNPVCSTWLGAGTLASLPAPQPAGAARPQLLPVAHLGALQARPRRRLRLRVLACPGGRRGRRGCGAASNGPPTQADEDAADAAAIEAGTEDVPNGPEPVAGPVTTAPGTILDRSCCASGRFAKRTGVTTGTLRYWEEQGVLRPVEKQPQQAVEALYFRRRGRPHHHIRELQDLLAFTLARSESPSTPKTPSTSCAARTAPVPPPRVRRCLLGDAIAANEPAARACRRPPRAGWRAVPAECRREGRPALAPPGPASSMPSSKVAGQLHRDAALNLVVSACVTLPDTAHGWAPDGGCGVR